MIIEEKDFKIIEHEKSYTLLITKFGKEAKDEETEREIEQTQLEENNEDYEN